MNNYSIDIDDLDDNSKELLENMIELDFFDDKEENSKLNSAYVHITDNCNLHCIGCYSYIDNRNTSKDLSLEQICIIFDKLSKSGVRKVIISGGEPFLRNDIVEICKYIKNNTKICELGVITNGTQDIEKYYKAIPFIDILSISIDGYDEATQFIRDKDIMSTVIETIKKLKSKTKIHLISTLHKKNKSFMKEYINFGKELGVTVSFSILSVDCNRSKKLKDFVLSSSDLTDISNTLSKMDKEYINTQKFLDNFELYCKDRCEAGRSLISIDSKGNIYPCHMLHIEELKLGNLLIDDLDSVINNPINKFRDIKVDNINTCFECDYKYLCGGGCRARSYYKHKNILEKDSYCQFQKNYFNVIFDNLNKLVNN